MVRPWVFLARFGPAATATAVVALAAAALPLRYLPRYVAIACVVGSWAATVGFARREVRTHASVVAAIAAVTAVGQTRGGLLYGVACAGFLLACVMAMRASRSAEPDASPGSGTPTPRRALVVLVVVASCVSTSIVLGLPWLAVRVERKLTSLFVPRTAEEATAFSTSMVLGSTRGMFQSDAIVMRIEGDRPEYLRGAVYDRYLQRWWQTSPAGRKRHVVDADTAAEPDMTRITLRSRAPNGHDMRWFLPPNACDLSIASGQVEVDAFGVARRAATAGDPRAIALRTRGCKQPPAPVAPPSPEDLEVSAQVAATIGPIAADWTRDSATDRAKLDAIARELGRFEYSLSVSRREELDPIVDFLTVHRAGHCEMFASAMVLLARTQRIPARVVGGYHVTEVNPLTGWAIVRDRNAHAWVEAWVDGAWRAWDPTPASEGARTAPGTLDHLGDLVSSWLEDVRSVLARFGPIGTAAVAAAGAGLFYSLRGIARLLRRRRIRAGAADAGHERPLPCFEELAAALASAGHVREASEPIEAFATRLARVTSPWASDAASAILRYAGLRYGGLGDEDAVVREVERAARAVRAGGPAPPQVTSSRR